MELSQYDIQYEPRKAIKGQAFADFLTETPGLTTHEGAWKVFVDGASSKVGSGVGVLLISPREDVFQLAVRLNFQASNNEAEYEAILASLQAAKQAGADKLIIHSDSQLAVNQLQGNYDIKDRRMTRYAQAFAQLKEGFSQVNCGEDPSG